MPAEAHQDVTSQPMPNPHLVNLNSPLSTSPLSQFNEYAPQLGQQIPDLKNVMFPSDNPFAYPNQPMATLESVDSRYGGYPDPSSMDSPFNTTSQDASLMGTPASIPSQLMTSNPEQQHHFPSQQQYDMASIQRMYGGYGSNQNSQQQQQQQQRLFDMSQQPPTSAGPQNQSEDYWNQMSKGGLMNLPSRTGLTPGGTVNLDELFGGGDAWGGAGMWEGHQGFARQ